jgi:hypothetical protein
MNNPRHFKNKRYLAVRSLVVDRYHKNQIRSLVLFNGQTVRNGWNANRRIRDNRFYDLNYLRIGRVSYDKDTWNLTLKRYQKLSEKILDEDFDDITNRHWK